MTRVFVALALAVGLLTGYFLFVRAPEASGGQHAAPAAQGPSDVKRVSAEAPAAERAAPGAPLETATFSSGCFWCTESDFDKVSGVVSTTSGYTGGHVVNPTYNQVSAGGTGHAESVELTFDPSVVTYAQLLDVYWHNVDPFNERGQFCDYGEQYRPVIWVHSAEQRAAAEASLRHMQELFPGRIVVGIEDAGPFYRAEDYHQDFHDKSAVRYKYYRWGCGRDARLADIWRSASAPY
jgi:peptide-methionine (S)-S-oxide reductase